MRHHVLRLDPGSERWTSLRHGNHADRKRRGKSVLSRHPHMYRTVLGRDPKEGAADTTLIDEQSRDPARGVDRHREADSLRILNDGRVDANHASARVDQRPTGVARI